MYITQYYRTESGGYEWEKGGELNIARVEKHRFCIQVHKKCNWHNTVVVQR